MGATNPRGKKIPSYCKVEGCQNFRVDHELLLCHTHFEKTPEKVRGEITAYLKRYRQASDEARDRVKRARDAYHEAVAANVKKLWETESPKTNAVQTDKTEKDRSK